MTFLENKMTTLDEVRKLQAQGRSEEEIVSALQAQGIQTNEIYDALSQARIKDAVSGTAPAPATPAAPRQVTQEAPAAPAPTAPATAPAPTAPAAAPAPTEEVYPAAPETYYPEGQQYYPPQGAVSAETISEISEQLIEEKLEGIRDKIKKSIDVKTKLEAKTEHIDERLKRLESIIDKLQLSILQKVGEYVTDVSDLKKELVETQKSFKAVSKPHKAHKTNHKTKTKKKHRKR